MTQFGRPMNLWAVGRNYADHAKELGNPVPASDEPMIFLKSGATVVSPSGSIRLPAWAREIHHEVELALRFDAKLEFDAITVALDLTARDIQQRLKSQGHPWTLAKSFIDSCPLGRPVSILTIPGGLQGIEALEFNLLVNGELRQKGFGRDMLHKPTRLRDYVVSRFPVQPGDWLLTGTPAGVGPIPPAARLEAAIVGVCQEFWTVS